MLDFQTPVMDADDVGLGLAPKTGQKPRRSGAKLFLDFAGAIILLVPFAMVACLLILLNPFFNRGPLWFVQDRMEYQCQPFAAIKFRTMRAAHGRDRGAFDALETERITVLGRLMRKIRIDELPQIINVLRGEMSLIGPRPDAYTHAKVYLQTIPGYRQRHDVLPGISGLAQTEIGYVDGLDGVRRKVDADLYYLANPGLGMELWIIWRTCVVVLSRRGA